MIQLEKATTPELPPALALARLFAWAELPEARREYYRQAAEAVLAGEEIPADPARPAARDS